MNKQKTLIFSLSAMLFIALAFIVYSWTEPTSMPSSYSAPINTGTDRQYKFGEIGATRFLDTDGDYYINPSGDSVVKGTISAANPTQDNHLTTKEYVDFKMDTVVTEDAIAAKLYYVGGSSGVLPSCPNGTVEVARHWLHKECQRNAVIAEFKGGWYGLNDMDSWLYEWCRPDSYDGVMCAGLDPSNKLFSMLHSFDECEAISGTVVTVEDNIKICKLPYSSLIGNCRNFRCTPGHYGSCVDTCSCPNGWKSYKNWSEASTYRVALGHTWSNTTRVYDWDDDYGYYSNIDFKGCY